jgi:hypothetical protein
MKKMLTAKEIINYLDKKSSELEGDTILQQINKIDSSENLSPAEVLNKMYELGYQRGMIMGKKEVLLEIALMVKLDDSNVDKSI